jgi:hypothetical protein
MGTWLLSTSTVVAPIRRAADRCSSGWTERSCLATMNQLGFERQADAVGFLGEQVRHRHRLGRPDKLLLRLRQVSGEARNTVRAQPDAPVRHFDVAEDVGGGELGLLAL